MNIRALIFDFDGTIADTEHAHFEGIRRVLLDEGIEVDWETYHARYIGYDDRGAFSKCFADQGRELDPERLVRLVDKKARLFPKLVAAQGLEPYPGVLDLLDQAKDRSIPAAVCTGALLSDVEPLLRLFGILDRFPVIVTADDVKHGKPDPMPYRLTVERLASIAPGLTPADCVAIEDTPAGICSARDAGIRTIGVANTHDPALLQDAWLVVPTLKGIRLFG